MPIPYRADRDSLYRPAQDASFFDSGTPESEAWLSAELARLAYVRPEDGTDQEARVRDALGGVGFDEVHFLNVAGTQAFFAIGQQRTVLVFRGTETGEPIDLGVDLLAVPVPWESGGAVHAGFKLALDHVRAEVATLLERRTGRLIFTGHSLGAALATLAAALWSPDAVYTFGSPRVGNAAFADSLAAKAIDRYRDCCDLVTTVPTGPVYTHVGRHHYINRNGRIVRDPGTWFILGDQTAAHLDYFVRYRFVPGYVKTRALADHAPINYVSAFTGRL